MRHFTVILRHRTEAPGPPRKGKTAKKHRDLLRYLPINEKNMQRRIFGDFIAKTEGGDVRAYGSPEFFGGERLDRGA
jgi:hypothetical protein